MAGGTQEVVGRPASFPEAPSLITSRARNNVLSNNGDNELIIGCSRRLISASG